MQITDVSKADHESQLKYGKGASIVNGTSATEIKVCEKMLMKHKSDFYSFNVNNYYQKCKFFQIEIFIFCSN